MTEPWSVSMSPRKSGTWSYTFYRVGTEGKIVGDRAMAHPRAVVDCDCNGRGVIG
ncbi:MAG: hypothetical protein NVS4B2_18990 [Chloroflexota bacterium]